MPTPAPPNVLLREEAGHELAALVWRFPSPVLTASTASVGGGLGLRRWVLNAQVSAGYSRVDLEEHVSQIAGATAATGLGVGMLTAVDVRMSHTAEFSGALAVATVGVTEPVWAASADPTAAAPKAGTINVLVQLPDRLDEGALINMIATVVEAKAQAFAEWGIPGTGTPSDAVTVVCPPDGPADRFGGPRSRWGARTAVAVHRAITAAFDSGAIR